MKLQDIIQKLKEAPGISQTGPKKFFLERSGVDFFIMHSGGNCVLNMREDNGQIVSILTEILKQNPDYTYLVDKRICYEWCFNSRTLHYRHRQLTETPGFRIL